jgi:hypothetical protein
MTDESQPHPLVVFVVIVVLVLLLSGCQHTWFPKQQQPQDGVTILEVQF